MSNLLSFAEISYEAQRRFKDQPSRYHDFIQTWLGLVKKEKYQRGCSEKEKMYGRGRRSR